MPKVIIRVPIMGKRVPVKLSAIPRSWLPGTRAFGPDRNIRCASLRSNVNREGEAIFRNALVFNGFGKCLENIPTGRYVSRASRQDEKNLPQGGRLSVDTIFIGVCIRGRQRLFLLSFHIMATGVSQTALIICICAAISNCFLAHLAQREYRNEKDKRDGFHVA